MSTLYYRQGSLTILNPTSYRIEAGAAKKFSMIPRGIDSPDILSFDPLLDLGRNNPVKTLFVSDSSAPSDSFTFQGLNPLMVAGICSYLVAGTSKTCQF